MNTKEPIIDFRDLVGSVRGEGLERLTSFLGDRLGLSPVWTGRGPDAGKDLTFTEIISGPLCSRMIKWVVSCKDKAMSGDAVQEKDLPNIADKIRQHRAQGFLLVTTTTVGVAAKALLDGNDILNSGDLHTKVWDSSDLSNMLLKPGNNDLLEQFLPASYKRVTNLHASVEDALDVLRQSMPPTAFLELRKLVAAAETVAPNEDSLKGQTIWPFETFSASKIDEITRFLVDEDDVNKAVEATTLVDINAFVALIERLYQFYPNQCFDYLSTVVRQHTDHDFVFNAYEFLSEHELLTRTEQIDFAAYLDEDELSLVYSSNIEAFVQRELLTNYLDYGIDTTFNGLSGMTALEQVDYIQITSLKLETELDAIHFWGGLEVSVILSHGPDAPASMVDVSGSFEGYIDAKRIAIESASVSTFGLDDFDFERDEAEYDE